MIPDFLGIDWTLPLRVLAAAVAGGILGINRDLRGKPIGLRTLSLVAVGSAGAVLLCADRTGAVDPAAMSRVLQGVMTGIGFLGAGVILHTQDGRSITGLTTAATIWVTAVLGVACGLGAWWPMLVVGVVVLGVLTLGIPIESAIHDWNERQKKPAVAGHEG